MEVVQGGATMQTYYKTMNRTISSSGSSSSTVKKRRKKIRKYQVEGDDEDESYEKIITKTKITIKKGKKGKGKSGEAEYEYEEYEDGGEAGNAEYMQMSGVYSMYLSSDVSVKYRTPKPASCMTWNGNKVKTFDGLIYTRNLYCSHTLVQDIVDGTFSVVLHSCPGSGDPWCPHGLEIYMQDVKYALKNDSKFYSE